MHEERIKELELQLAEASDAVARLTKANAELTTGLEYAERMLKKAKRNSRSDSDSLRTQISNLQNRRG